MLEKMQSDVRAKMAKCVDVLHKELSKIRTGRPNPSLFDEVSIDYYGTETPLKQAASITASEGRSLVISPWDKKLLPEIERAIMAANLGLMPSTSGDVIRVNMPPLTEETRQEFVRHAREKAEQSRVHIRNIRREFNADLKERVKKKEMGEDDERHGEELVQKITDSSIAEVEKVLADKEAELMEV